MPLKADYLATVDVNDATYGNAASAEVRIREIYQTARRGRLSAAHGAHLWTNFFMNLHRQLNTVPVTQISYDAFATRHILLLATLLRNSELGDFGIAQKMYNLFMKDHWASNVFPAQIEELLHLPLDRIILSKLGNCPPSWNAWTKVVVTPDSQLQVLAAYVQIQQSFRDYWRRTEIFASPIEMEQFIWHRI